MSRDTRKATIIMNVSCLSPDDLEPNETVLNNFPGIWFVTSPEGSLIVAASKNYYEKARGNWHALPPEKLPNGLVVNWLIRPLWTALGGEKAALSTSFQTGKVIA
jgi:hypothetical protein